MSYEPEQIYVCDECHRILEAGETRIVDTPIGGIRIPYRHVDYGGALCTCDGEVIEPWWPA